MVTINALDVAIAKFLFTYVGNCAVRYRSGVLYAVCMSVCLSATACRPMSYMGVDPGEWGDASPLKKCGGPGV